MPVGIPSRLKVLRAALADLGTSIPLAILPGEGEDLQLRTWDTMRCCISLGL